MIKAIIFDCFGVLVGHGFWNVYKSLGGDPMADERFITEHLEKADLGQVSSHDFHAIMANHLGVPLAVYEQAFKDDEVLNPDIFDYIENELRPRYKLALVSNATGDSVRSKIPASKLALFDEVFISGEVGLLKPDPKLFNLALQKLGTSAQETLFVDDHQEYIDGAKAVGLQTIQYTTFEAFKKDLPQH